MGLNKASGLLVFLVCLTAAAQVPGTFASTGSMITPRFAHTATLLPDGKVLIAGGDTLCVVGGPCRGSNSAELYDPATHSFAPTGTMSTADLHIGGILLADERVLFVSFSYSAVLGSLAAIELYDPATGSFQVTGNTVALTYATSATLLKDGRVLIAGFAGSYSACGAEIYDPVAATSTPVLNGLADAPFAAIALADGRVLFQFYEDDAKIYDPVSGRVTDAGGLCCFDGPPQANLLLNGIVLFSGGNDIGGSESSVELFDPTAGTFIPPLKMSVARDGHSSTLLPDGTVLIAGGLALANRSKPAVASAEIFDTTSGAFFPTGSLATGRAGAAAVLLNDGRVLITGGSTFLGSGLPTSNPISGLSSSEIYTPSVLVAAPGLVSLSGEQAAIQHGDTYQLVTTDNPAVAGEVIVIYCSGLIAGSVIPPQISIGGRMAEVLYFGSAPGFVGLNQINARVPSGIASGSNVPLRLTYLGRSSNRVNIGVR